MLCCVCVLFMCLCVCECVYKCLHICVRVCVYVSVRVRVCVCVSALWFIWFCICMYDSYGFNRYTLFYLYPITNPCFNLSLSLSLLLISLFNPTPSDFWNDRLLTLFDPYYIFIWYIGEESKIGKGGYVIDQVFKWKIWTFSSVI